MPRPSLTSLPVRPFLRIQACRFWWVFDFFSTISYSQCFEISRSGFSFRPSISRASLVPQVENSAVTLHIRQWNTTLCLLQTPSSLYWWSVVLQLRVRTTCFAPRGLRVLVTGSHHIFYQNCKYRTVILYPVSQREPSKYDVIRTVDYINYSTTGITLELNSTESSQTPLIRTVASLYITISSCVAVMNHAHNKTIYWNRYGTFLITWLCLLSGIVPFWNKIQDFLSSWTLALDWLVTLAGLFRPGLYIWRLQKFTAYWLIRSLCQLASWHGTIIQQIL